VNELPIDVDDPEGVVAASIQVVQPAQPMIVVQGALAAWSLVPCPELAVVLVRLKALAELHQSHHWTAQGDHFYGDHLLFERLYNAVVGEVDAVAERAVGAGGAMNVLVGHVAQQVADLLATQPASTIPSSADLAKASLAAEREFVTVLDALIVSLRENGRATHGTVNLLEDVASTHESHVYLLQQRVGQSFTGGSL
jgi:DNA-binding ferritin-like protein